MRFSILCRLLVVAAVVIFMPVHGTSAQGTVTYTVDVYATVPGCGDGIIQFGEQCDGSNLGGVSCELLGFAEGTLRCSSVCTQITAACVVAPPSVTGGVRRSPDSDSLIAPDTNFVVTGYSAPGAVVTLLKDAERAGFAVTDNDGFFQITISGLSAGVYTMQLIAEKAPYRANVDAFRVTVTSNVTTKVSDIYFPALFTVKNTGASAITAAGLSLPNATIIVYQGGVPLVTTKSAGDGTFSFSLPVSSLVTSDDLTIVTMVDGREVAVSDFVLPAVEVSTTDQPRCVVADITGDCRVNLVDFAIAVWMLVYDPQSLRFDYDSSGVLDIVDFSIMAYYWTG